MSKPIKKLWHNDDELFALARRELTMKFQKIAGALFIFLTSGVLLSASQSSGPKSVAGDPYADETPAQRDARMAWWREAKFGMFIHWGVYAVPAGVHEGVRDAEWIMHGAKIPVKRYRAYAREFNATNYNPAAWVKLAQEAGMRYMVITAKHHDGFALFPTKVSDWNAVDATPCKKDLIAPLAQAARAQGLKFGLYYSHSQDWVHPGRAKWRLEEGGGWDAAHKGSYDDYLDQIAVPQVREILTLYQPDVLWWDTPHYMTQPRAEKLIRLLKLRPGIIHNDRLGGGYAGDTETPEGFIPPTGYPGRDWETCMTMNDNWGYVKDDHDWMSFAQIIGQLVDIVSKGGNYLLNVGPDASGQIPEESVQRLKQVGAWLQVNGEAIYGTQASPFKCRLSWGRCTFKQQGADTILYAHVLKWPENREIVLPGLQNRVRSAALLATGEKIKTGSSRFGPVLRLPAQAPDVTCSVIKVLITGAPQVKETPITADPDGVIRLTPMDARIQGQLKLDQRHNGDYITGWKHPEDTGSWELQVVRDGAYTVQVKSAAAESGAVLMICGVGELRCPVPKSENIRTNFIATQVGEIRLKKGDKVSLQLQPVAQGWQPVNVQSVELIPRR